MTRPFFVSSEHKGSWSYHIILRLLQHAFPSTTILEWESSHSQKPPTPDLLVRATHAHLEGSKFSDAFRIPYFMFSGESFHGGPRSYPPLWKFQTVHGGPKEEKYWFPYFLFHPMVDSPLGIQRRGRNILERPFFLVYTASNPCHHRNQFFEVCLRKHPEGCHGRGDCYNNYAKIKGDWSNVADAFADYTFALVMENKMESGYITEKILNAYLAGCIPIYYGGGTWTKTLFNSESYIDVSDFPSFEACVDHMVHLYTHERQTLETMQKAPIFKSKEVGDDLYSIFHSPCSQNSKLSPRYRSVVDALRQTFPTFT